MLPPNQNKKDRVKTGSNMIIPQNLACKDGLAYVPHLHIEPVVKTVTNDQRTTFLLEGRIYSFIFNNINIILLFLCCFISC